MHNIMTTLGDTTQKDIHEMTLNFKRLLIASNGDNRMKEKMKTQLDSWWEEVEEVCLFFIIFFYFYLFFLFFLFFYFYRKRKV